MTQSIDKLKKSNFSAFVLHALSAATVVFLYIYYKSEPFSNATVYRYDFAGPEELSGTCTTGSVTPGQCNTDENFTKPHDLFSINVIFACLAFFIFTAFAHLFYATDGFHTGSYSRVINAGWNPYRWGEYAISASIMTVIVGLVQGIRDASTLGSLVTITAAMQLCGLAVESNLKYSFKHVNTDSVTSSTSAGWMLFAGLWGVLILNFALAVSVIDSKYEGSVPAVRIPSWVWIVVFLNLVYYALFGIVQWYHIRSRLHSPNFNYNNVEYWYIILSYVSKLSLAAGVSYGLILRTKDCPQP